ncbi:glycoside hydrolase family 38 C-terminal domain-containing protein, partial [Pedobacter sp.]|uniref:glycoside hydrolase family 38 N-terminal domain-containing protein n=1 Tax=Pedobacter sp. TaxID=1411316 RepID=UPI003D7F9F97
MKNLQKVFLVFFFLCPNLVFSQKAYFIDGYHGGMWGHYPMGYTSFIVEQLNKHPDWNINLEIEPETWDRELKADVNGYNAFSIFLKDSTVNSRIEYVNPTYSQPYMYNISGESIIRQFSYGMATLKRHFPFITFKTYSSEEPCFTSALPQLLKSFGFQYASLKNPNTGWGGYTRAFGKELVNWIGPDGSSILTSPRYQIEALMSNSTWETIGNGRNNDFIPAAFNNGIKNPVAMSLQDAGWLLGPWLRDDFHKPTVYTTWRNYFENIAEVQNVENWNLSQEDVLTSLVWGAQVVQKLAQQTRVTENKVIQAEKIAVIRNLEDGTAYPSSSLDQAWRSLMLAQHHDTWIVPYNGDKGDTWADKVSAWTDQANEITNGINVMTSTNAYSTKVAYLKVFNTLANERNEWVKALLPAGLAKDNQLIITDQFNNELPSQLLQEGSIIAFKAKVPALGFVVYEIKKGKKKAAAEGAKILVQKNGDYILESDLYRIRINKAEGGTVKSLVAKGLKNKEFVDQHAERKFNELRGNFYRQGGFKTNADQPASLNILENGPYILSIKIESEIAGHPLSQQIELIQGQPLINCNIYIDWKKNEGIGEFEETNYKSENLHKAFYNDKYKLLTLFPLALENQQVYKDAPFDVTKSRLENTFFSTWDSIKNNIVLNWVDVLSGDQKYGMSLFTDHTTSYAHGKNFPLGLTTQYAGYGLWGRNYTIKDATEIKYSLLPHVGNWQKAGVSYQNQKINEPLQVNVMAMKPSQWSGTFIETSSKMLELTSCVYKG